MPAHAYIEDFEWDIQEPRARAEDRGYLRSFEHAAEVCDEPTHLEEAKAWTVVSSTFTSSEARFVALVDEWKKEVKAQSSLAKISFHPAYQAILAMGKDALPFIMKDLSVRLDHWFYALRLITQEDVGRGAKSLEEARQKWLEWGRHNSYLK